MKLTTVIVQFMFTLLSRVALNVKNLQYGDVVAGFLESS